MRLPDWLSLAATLAILLTLTVLGAAAPGFTVGPTTATPSPVAPGSGETIRTRVAAASAASNVLVDFELYSPAGARVAQSVIGGQSFAAGESKPYAWSYAVPASLPTGPYTVKLGVFSGDWATLYTWDNQAATFTVGGGGPPPPPPGCTGGFTTGPSTATPSPVAPGATETIQAKVCSGAAASNILVYLELYNPSGTRVAQNTFGGQSFAAGESKSYSWPWPVPASAAGGTYTVKLGVFSGDWATLYRWDNQAATFTVGGGPPPPPPSCTGGFTTGPNTATPSPVAPGATETIQAKVCSGAAASNILVYLELYSPGGTRVAQNTFGDQSFAAGESKSYSWPWPVPAGAAGGTYTVKIGVFSGDWATLYRWDNQAVTFDVGSASASVTLVPVATGLWYPVAITHAGDSRIFVGLKTGQVMVLRDGQVLARPFLDLSSRVVSTAGEQGLLSVAFDPRYATTGRFYVVYTAADADPAQNPGGHLVLARYAVSAADPDVADPASEAVLLSIPHLRFASHYGGQLQFGPDGYLYLSTGDGGTGGFGDADGNAQNLGSRLGKLLRLDVSGAGYAVPADNPFVATAGAWPEIWALGLRNPWRFSFDHVTGDLILGDVGETSWEEIDFQPAGSRGGANYGWNVFEGAACYPPGTVGCGPATTAPVLQYDHSAGDCSIIGGYAYRGTALALTPGTYVFGDYCSGRIRTASPTGGSWSSRLLLDSTLNIVAFGEGLDGELYVAHLSFSGPDGVYRLAPAP